MSAAKNIAARLARSRGAPPGVADSPGPDLAALAEVMRNHPNFAALGAIGPDIFFFLPDFRNFDGVETSTVLIKVLEFLEGLYDAVDPYVTKYERFLGPISEDQAEEVSRLTGGLSETFGDITGELRDILITAIEDLAIELNDWWEFFSLGLDKGYDEQSYFWSDMLHYRCTGTFARALWTRANNGGDDQARAYALGYATHVSTDVTGHGFVNTIAGGPYRLHWQRHHLVENHMDASWYLSDPLSPGSGDRYAQLTESALYFDIAFGDDGAAVERPAYPAGRTMRDNWQRGRVLDLDSDLPEEIAQLLKDTIEDVYYHGEPHPQILSDDGRPSVENIQEAYRLLYRFLKLTTVDGFSHEPPPPPDVFPNLDFPTLPGMSDGPPGEDDGLSCDDFWDCLLSILSVLLWIVEVAAYLLTLPWAIIADIVTYPLRLGLYYAFELPLFYMLKMFRYLLVMSGYMLPMEDEISQGLIHIGQNETTLYSSLLEAIADVFGSLLDDVGEPKRETTWRDRCYPRQHPPDEYRHPWAYPRTATELGLTTAGPHARDHGPGDLFVDRPADPNLRARLEQARTPDEVDAIDRDLSPQQNLGDAVGFGKYLIWLATREGDDQPTLVDWNLDADRGYAYHCWDWNRQPKADDDPTDPEGLTFRKPCTWPPQSEDGEYDPRRRLQVHWTGHGLEDPGCSDEGPMDYPEGCDGGKPRWSSRGDMK